MNRECKSEYSAAGRFFAPISTVRVIWREGAAKGSWTRERITWAFGACVTSNQKRNRLLRAIVQEESVAGPEEVLRMRTARVLAFGRGIRRARVLQILVETVLSDVVVQ